MSTSDYFKNYFKKNESLLIDEFFEFLKFKSISTESEFSGEVRACVNWLENKVSSLGFKTELWETSRHPILYAEDLRAGKNKPTILIYNHYDVQPVDPLELWHSPPFEPQIRDGEIYARGAQDNKGQCFYVLNAIKALKEKNDLLPVNIKLCIEGEEEAGSVGLQEAIAKHANKLKADYLAVVDMGVHSLNQPAVTVGLRGIAHLHLEVIGSNSDLHSGLYGGIAHNPLHALVEILAKLRDKDGKILVPGFYDDVLEIDKKEKSKLDLSFDSQEYETTVGGKPTGGERFVPPVESGCLRPTLEINGIGGGYFGSGFKTVIPAKAVAKISTRLVPNQDAKKIICAVKDFILANAPEGVTIKIEDIVATGGSLRTSTENTGAKAAAKSYEEVLGKKCGFILSGGSIPIIAKLSEASNAEPILLGLGLPEDNIHAPNEHFGIKRIELGMALIGRLIEIIAE